MARSCKKVLVYTRTPEYASSITARHWTAALFRNAMDDLDHELVLCHSEEELEEHLPAADVIVSSKANLRTFISPAHANVRLIFFAFAGVDHLAPFDWVPPGAFVVNNSGASGRPVAEYTLFALQLLTNGIIGPPRVPLLTAASQNGFRSLASRTVTIVGAGGMGGSIAAMCRQFRMHVQGIRRSEQPHPAFDVMHQAAKIDAVIASSDFVVVACPLTTETRGLFDASMIARMQRGAGLVNVARGAIVDEQAICDAVERGHLGGAVLDVVSADASDAAARVRNTPGILVTPHVSGDDQDHFIDNSLDVFMGNLRQWLGGAEPSNAIDFQLGY